MPKIDIIAQMDKATVVAEYECEKRKAKNYQTEEELENEFIELLKGQSYEYLPIHSEDELVENLRTQLEKLNDYKFTDAEWERFFDNEIANNNEGIVEKTRTIQEDYIKNLRRDDNTTKNIKLIDKKNIHNNILQVINQYEEKEGKYDTRYDVSILVNGLPLVHIELKRRGVAIKEAFNQINRYGRDSFWAGSALFEYVQIFVISNGTDTKYYSNTTRWNHIKDQENKKVKQKTSNSFEFTSFWADSKNKVISDLVDFTKTFFSKHTILNVITKYCIFTSDNMLLAMRPYQIVATERIINRIELSTNYKKYGTIDGGGYIWHTTGSGKTLTSFKTARLATSLDYIDKVLFVVDRQDLDYQTMREYDKFEKNAANSNRSTAILQKQLESPNAKIIITTIQKLSTFINKNKKHDIYDKHIVLIFDECHRSQFGEMHTSITKTFKKYHIFGFTGTPIFAKNASSGKKIDLKTTEQAFGDKLHSYTIVDAIKDQNVLPFKIEHYKTIDIKDDIKDTKVYDIDREKIFLHPQRIANVTKYIIENFNRKTYHNQYEYKYNVVSNVNEITSAKDRNQVKENKKVAYINGFNSIFAVSSIDAAKLYYTEFKKQLASLDCDLKVGLIYSFCPNEDEKEVRDVGVVSEENSDDTSGLDTQSRDFLESAIKDYNEMFGTMYDTSSDKFQNYYKDVSLRMKNKELDILIVVNMFLTGFDATTLNTLWVDKNLRMHGLIQAFSRTNRILNSVKVFGNIVCFRNLVEETDEAIALFGDKDAKSVVIIKSYNDYYNGYKDEDGTEHKGYKELVTELFTKFALDTEIIGENDKKDFLVLFGKILRAKNILVSFDDFSGNEIFSERDFQDYCSKYLDMRKAWLDTRPTDKKNVSDDVVFEMELLKQVEINIDYILNLIDKYHETHCKNKEILIDIMSAIGSSPELRSKKDLIESFINELNEKDNVFLEWKTYVAEKKEKELKSIIEKENLNENNTRKFVADSFESGEIKTTGTDIDKILPPMSMFDNGNRNEKKQNVIVKIKGFFEKFFGIG